MRHLAFSLTVLLTTICLPAVVLAQTGYRGQAAAPERPAAESKIDYPNVPRHILADRLARFASTIFSRPDSHREKPHAAQSRATQQALAEVTPAKIETLSSPHRSDDMVLTAAVVIPENVDGAHQEPEGPRRLNLSDHADPSGAVGSASSMMFSPGEVRTPGRKRASDADVASTQNESTGDLPEPENLGPFSREVSESPHSESGGVMISDTPTSAVLADGSGVTISDSEPTNVIGDAPELLTTDDADLWVGDSWGEAAISDGCAGPNCRECGGRGCYLPGLNGCSALMKELCAPRRVWGRTEYLWWSPDGDTIPALVTTSPPGTAQNVAGQLGQPTTTVLFGNEDINGQERAGGRLQAGVWLVDGQMEGISGEYFRLESANSTTSFSSTGTPILARPFNNLNPANPPALGNQDVKFIAFPNFVDAGLGGTIQVQGSVNIATSSDIRSAGVMLRHMLWADCTEKWWYRLYMLGGYRYFNVNETLTIRDTVFPIGGFFAGGFRIDSVDDFDLDNEFHGGDMGFALELNRGRLVFEALAKVALGNVRQTAEISGSTATFDSVNTVITSGGLLTQPSNIGTYRQDEFGIIPEVGLNLGLQITRGIRVFGGYSLIYVNELARPSGVVNLNINPRQSTGPPAAPVVSQLGSGSFWMHGVNAGVELRF